MRIRRFVRSASFLAIEKKCRVAGARTARPHNARSVVVACSINNSLAEQAASFALRAPMADEPSALRR